MDKEARIIIYDPQVGGWVGERECVCVYVCVFESKCVVRKIVCVCECVSIKSV